MWIKGPGIKVITIQPLGTKIIKSISVHPVLVEIFQSAIMFLLFIIFADICLWPQRWGVTCSGRIYWYVYLFTSPERNNEESLLIQDSRSSSGADSCLITGVSQQITDVQSVCVAISWSPVTQIVTQNFPSVMFVSGEETIRSHCELVWTLKPQTTVMKPETRIQKPESWNLNPESLAQFETRNIASMSLDQKITEWVFVWWCSCSTGNENSSFLFPL